MKNCILISSYCQHKYYLDKFLYSIQRLTPNNIPVYIIISRDEEDEFHYMTNKYKNVNLLTFSKIMELLDDIKIAETNILREYGKYNFQSLKKYYGLYYLFSSDKYDNVIIFDSESMVVRDVDINVMISEYMSKPFLIYSEDTTNTKDLHVNVDNAMKEMLGINGNIGWFLEYYQWIYEKRIFVDFMKFLIDKYECTIFELFHKFEEIFIEIVYQSYINKNNSIYK